MFIVLKEILTDEKIFTLIVIINLIGIIIGFGTVERQTMMANNSIKEDRLKMIKEKGIITVAGPAKEIPFFMINPETNEMSGIDAGLADSIIINHYLIKENNPLLRQLKKMIFPY